tara:strand:+ start:3714 stop:4031 length:318 start_codon:yes stop_codon:yes gene_type:complete
MKRIWQILFILTIFLIVDVNHYLAPIGLIFFIASTSNFVFVKFISEEKQTTIVVVIGFFLLIVLAGTFLDWYYESEPWYFLKEGFWTWLNEEPNEWEKKPLFNRY